MAWLTVPSEWWQTNENIIDDPVSGVSQVKLNGYHYLVLSTALTDEQRQPSRIRITYDVAATATGTDTYFPSSSFSLEATGITTVSESSTETAIISSSDTIEETLTLIDFFYDITLTVDNEIYGSNCSGSITACEIISVQFYYEEEDCVPCWTAYVNTTEECVEI